MSTNETLTATETELKLTPPDPVPVVAPEQAVGLVPVAEEIGFVPELGRWVFETACRQSRAWTDAGLRTPRLAVNLSPRQFRQALDTERHKAAVDAADLGVGSVSNGAVAQATPPYRPPAPPSPGAPPPALRPRASAHRRPR